LNYQTLKALCQGEKSGQAFTIDTFFANRRNLTTNRESAASINIHRE
jgi:hypothetical protein